MLLLSFHHSGKRYDNCTAEQLLDLGVPQNTIDTAILNQHKEGIRTERNRRLTAADWTQMGGSPLTGTKKSEWAQYRKDLRDLPATITSIDDQPVWPDEPAP